jgi:hypothetical protein
MTCDVSYMSHNNEVAKTEGHYFIIQRVLVVRSGRQELVLSVRGLLELLQTTS